MTPEEIWQIIIGSNGSGKSALLAQITPLPAEKEDFGPNGSKVTIWKDGHTEYVCTTQFIQGESPHHSFILDGVEKNPGGTATVQKELCLTHMRVDSDIHDLMLSRDVRFTAMSVATRREWFTRLCATDYDFALSAYNQINQRHNRVKGALKENKKQLVTEVAKLVSKEEETKLEAEVAALLDELNMLTQERMPVGKGSAHYLTHRDQYLASLSEISMRLLKNKVIAPFEYFDGPIERDEWGQPRRVSFKSVEEIEAEIDLLRHLETTKEVQIAGLSDQFAKLDKDHNTLIAASESGFTNLIEQIGEMNKEFADLERQRRLDNVTIDNPRLVLDSLQQIKEPLCNLLTSMPNNSDRTYGRKRLQELQAEFVQLEERRVDFGNKAAKHRAKLDHADEHRKSSELHCPKCGHGFSMGLSEAQYKITEELWKECEKEIKRCDEKREVLRSEIKLIEDYIAQYREFLGYTEKATILKPLWNHLVGGAFVVDAPMEAVNQIRLFERDAIIRIKIVELEERMANARQLQKAKEEVGNKSLAEIAAQIEVLSEQLGSLSSKLNQLKMSINAYQQYRKQILAGEKLAEEVKQMYLSAREASWQAVEEMRRESIIQCINQIQQVLAMKQESLRGIQTQRAIVQNLEEFIEKLTVQEKATKLMVEALSPVNGLIAEGLIGFIRNFVGQMNTVIARIFTYPLRIIPTGYDMDKKEQSAELDYRFKYLVDSSPRPVKDVVRGSDGQREIIDYAFKMTALQHLRLTHSPLLFDEFGRTLDPVHRTRAYADIKENMESGNFSQLFMISHYEEVYNSFPYAQICVIDSNNVPLHSNKEYNPHVQMT